MSKTGEGGEKASDGGECWDQWLVSATRRLAADTLLAFFGSATIRRRWPLVLGMGIGVGQSIAGCREALREQKEKEEEDQDKKKAGEAPEGKEMKENKK